MYECPNCAGNLKFNIAKQQMYCAHCDTMLDPYSVSEGRNATEHNVTIFTCSQCGGELISDDTTAATFCSFCGSTALLESRVSKERRPAKIIPFVKTQEDCRKAYARMVRRALFAPKELEDEANIEKFRGIYMPYWVYSFEKSGSATFEGKQCEWDGNWKITKHYQVTTDIVEDYKGLAYDASASFSDSLSEDIAPFDYEQAKEFTPAFLSGFYADTNDVDASVYQQEAEELVLEDAYGKFGSNNICASYSVDAGEMKGAVEPDTRKAELFMLPVWFLSYRKKDRMFYAVVNGQTGKATAEIPVDIKKYLFFSILLAVPFFLLLNGFLMLTPVELLFLTIAVSVGCILIADAQMSAALARDMNVHDVGLMAFQDKQEEEEIQRELRKERASRDGMYQDTELQEQLRREKMKKRSARMRLQEKSAKNPMGHIGMLVFYTLMVAVVGMVFFDGMEILWMYGRYATFFSVVLVGMFLTLVFVMTYFMFSRSKFFVLTKPLIGVLIAVVILVVNPVEDLYYYAGVVACMFAVQWSIVDIIKQYNRFTTRKLPQFNRKGGDERA